MTRPAYGGRGRWLLYGLAGVVMGGWSVTYLVALNDQWQPSATRILVAIGYLAVAALTAVVVWWLYRRRRRHTASRGGCAPGRSSAPKPRLLGRHRGPLAQSSPGPPGVFVLGQPTPNGANDDRPG